MHKTSAWPLALITTALIFYASLYPFTGWRNQGVEAWAFLLTPWPRYWTSFDVISNTLGYAPLGFLLVLSVVRTQLSTWSGRHPILIATLACTLLSLAMETLQNYLPSRVPSNLDLGLNMLGGWLGSLSALALEKWGALDRWSHFRARWFVSQSRGALVLLALWPPALLFPPAVPFGLGQMLQRLELALADTLAGTPLFTWLPMHSVEFQPLVPVTELLCVLLGILAPCLIGYSVTRTLWQRSILSLVIFLIGAGTSSLSAALSYGPSHAWGWLSPSVLAGLALAAPLALVCVLLPRRSCAALALLVLAIDLSTLNQAPTSAYFAQTLQTWEQGRFIRFHGLAQWLGWLWPYVALVYVLLRVSARDGHSDARQRLH